MGRMPIDIVATSDRNAVCLALYHAGRTARQRRQ